MKRASYGWIMAYLVVAAFVMAFTMSCAEGGRKHGKHEGWGQKEGKGGSKAIKGDDDDERGPSKKAVKDDDDEKDGKSKGKKEAKEKDDDEKDAKGKGKKEVKGDEKEGKGSGKKEAKEKDDDEKDEGKGRKK
ncbi:MAG: hypothetical protein NTX50_10710 [Candidatus Sumerlaeota bacterium]|nr:hypothetical protein [Candidatus Sumerlaeota bacterium]